MRVRTLVLTVLTIPVLVLAGSVPARGVDTFPVCIGLKSSGLGVPAPGEGLVPPEPPGAPHVDFTLSAVALGASFHLAGEAVFSQAIPPPDGLIVYSVSGTAILNDDSFWISLTGAGFNDANEVFNGTFAIRLRSDATQNTLTYSRQSLDASSTVTLTGVPELKPCP